jgi:hypothetical protein
MWNFFITRVWPLIEYYLTKLIDYKFRKKSIFWWGIKITTGLLITEMADMLSDFDLEDIYKLLREVGGAWAVLIVKFLVGIFTGFDRGYSVFTICIKVYLITLFSILEWRKDRNFEVSIRWFWAWNWNWKIFSDNSIELNLVKIVYGSADQWHPSIKWFKEINETYRLNKNKYITDLHIESNLEKKLFDQIVNEKDKVTAYEQAVKNCRIYLAKLKAELNELIVLLEDKKDPLKLSERSRFYIDYNNIIVTAKSIDVGLDQINNLTKVRANRDVEINQVYFPILSTDLNEYINSYSFDLLKVKASLASYNKYEIRRRLFNAFSPLLLSVRNLNETIDNLNNIKEGIKRNHFIVHAKAGVGKTYFSAHIYNSLKREHLPLFVTASSFSGNHSSLSHAFQKVFKYPEAISLKVFFLKLNEFAKKKKKRVVLIIDGLNETTYNLSGFSPIWGDSIENLTEDISEFDHLTFLATCRTSYLENNIDASFSLKCSHALKGFENFKLRKRSIDHYFKYYNIESNTITNRNSLLFSIPLILRTYCEGKNGNRTGMVKVELNHNSYEETIHQFVETECINVAEELGRPSTTPIYNGINRSSESFVQEITASLNYDSFLESTQGKVIDEIFKSTSIACKFLESEHLFMKDFQPYFKGERVVHTFQNIGGYLLAKFLYGQYNDPADFVTSNEFTSLLSGAKKNRISGDLNNNSHQLALDVMLFMVYKYSKNSDPNYTGDLIDHTKDPLVLEYTWRFVSDYWGFAASTRLEEKLKSLSGDINLWDGLFESNIDEYLDKDTPLNFKYIKEFLLEIDASLSEITWSKNIYENSQYFQDFLKLDYSEFTNEREEIALEITIWLLESTSHNLRDEATNKLLKHGSDNPEFIFSKIEEYANKKRLYIYARLAGIAYGICLRKQNDQTFITNELKYFAQTVYDLQFNAEPIAPSYHYIVIDSFKHIIDLAIHLGVFELPEGEINDYKFEPNEVWEEITDEDMDKVTIQWTGTPDPDPLSGDFVTYTIPRLLDSAHEGHLEAVAHIYKRLIKAGYKPKSYGDLVNGVDKDFYFGSSKYGTEGKVDRLGKKYSWNAYFEYAGYLLNNNQLNIIGEDDSAVFEHYNRLGDVQIEVSKPLKNYLDEKLFSGKLLADKTDNSNWTEIEKFDSLNEVFDHDFDTKKFTLLYGYYVENEKSEHSYNVRSFLLVEPFLVKKADIEGKEAQILNRTLEWDHDLHSGGSISHAYYGELYWADSIPDMKSNRESIPSTETHEIDHSVIDDKMSMLEKMHAREMAEEGKGKELVPIQIPITVEPAIVQYLWESDSEVYPSLSGNIPSPNIGKYLNLKSDSTNFQILDKNSERAFISVEYEEDEILKQESDYIRTDLLKKYLDDKGLVLMYQIKQHTFDRNAGDGNGDFRGMQFKIQEL